MCAEMIGKGNLTYSKVTVRKLLNKTFKKYRI